MKILIAYDGSGYSHSALDDLRDAGLPPSASALLLSISETWLPPNAESANARIFLDNEIAEYFQKHSEQISRNFRETKEILHEAQTELQKYFPDWMITTQAINGSPAQMILQKISEFKPDLAVVGAQGLSSERGLGLGSVSNKILSESHTSVRVVRGNAETDPDHLKIAICFDNSPCSLEAVKTVAARRWNGTPEIRLLVVTDLFIALIPGRAFRLIPGVPEGRMKGEEKWVESLATVALNVLADAGLSAQLYIYSGNPRIMLVNETKTWKADMTFIGANSRLTPNHSLGCVASAVATRADCSVEVIRK